MYDERFLFRIIASCKETRDRWKPFIFFCLKYSLWLEKEYRGIDCNNSDLNATNVPDSWYFDISRVLDG